MTELKFCNYVLREISKKQHQSFTWPFQTPVDPDALGIPHYREVITNPMDLSTMRKKLDVNEYTAAEEFEADFRLMINNCYTFNPEGTDIYLMGKQLELFFDQKWAEMSNFLSQHGDGGLSRGKSFDTSDSDDDGNF
jgi:bromodomain-containing factor 1